MDTMASSGKKKTTMAKLTRESRLRERRFEKEARKRARKDSAAERTQADAEMLANFDPSNPPADLMAAGPGEIVGD